MLRYYYTILYYTTNYTTLHYTLRYRSAHTTCASAYLTPKITAYLDGFLQGFADDGLVSGKVPLTFIQSDGGLSPYHSFGGHLAILSGPAGGVVGYSKTTPGQQPMIGFDMGGTSTDVSRYDPRQDEYELVLETTIDGVAIQAPQLDIHTVAAGGGSRLFWKHGLLQVGPESARAHPGPVCYRKDGGVLAVTDANLVLGRLLPQEFPRIFGPSEDQPLDVDASREAFQELLQSTIGEQSSSSSSLSLEELASGYIQVANEAMCRPIRNLTQMKGHDLGGHTLACFGGAGPQHACAMAQALGMSRVFVHRYGGVLSAYGLSMADAVADVQEPTGGLALSATDAEQEYAEPLRRLKEQAVTILQKQGFSLEEIVCTTYLNLRYQGTDNAIMTTTTTTGSTDDDDKESYQVVFEEQYQREFGFTLQRPLLVDDVRIRARVPGKSAAVTTTTTSAAPTEQPPQPSYTTKAFFGKRWQQVGVYHLDNKGQLKPGHVLQGPAIIIQSISTIVLEEHCSALITPDGDLDITVGTTSSNKDEKEDKVIEPVTTAVVDPIQLSIFSHRFMGIAEQMGRTLQRTAISVNMKERLDFSCALFTKEGGLVANAPHIPVHLGAMQEAVKFQCRYWNDDVVGEGIQPGDVLVSNHPQLAGGSHLPDITVVTPVFGSSGSNNNNKEILFFVASRGHHADIGGIAPGSMPPHSKTLSEEGAMIVAFKLVKQGQFDTEGITELLKDSRNLPDNLSDLRAQVAANHAGIGLLHQLVEEYSLETVQRYMAYIQDNAEQAVRSLLKDFRKRHGSDIVIARDAMDDGSPICLKITLSEEEGTAVFDFTGTGAQVLANHNAPPAVTYSAVIYALRCLVQEDIPLNQGCLAPITFVIPKGSLLNPTPDAAVVGGNVLTSQRIVDVVLQAFKACAASQGCMNNLTFGIDGRFGYYETIAGGAGAGPTWHGVSGVHTHCTNTRITDPEILERRYPIVLRRFGLRPNSGGDGEFRGGDGVVRELEPLTKMTMSILSERRVLQPYGMAGGEPGRCGRNILVRKDGLEVSVGGRCSTTLVPGERLRIESPGGGGYGSTVVVSSTEEDDAK